MATIASAHSVAAHFKTPTHNLFRDRRHTLKLRAYPEQRLQAGLRRYRVPDICVVELPEPDEQIFTRPPFICIEILSPEDSFRTLQDRLDDYLTLGVPNIWVLDPKSRRAWHVTPQGHLEARDGILRTSDDRIHLPVADLFVQFL